MKTRLKASAKPLIGITERELNDMIAHGCDLSMFFTPDSFESDKPTSERILKYRQAKHSLGAKLMTDEEIDAMSDGDFDMLMSSLEEDDDEKDDDEEKEEEDMQSNMKASLPSKVTPQKVEAQKVVPENTFKGKQLMRNNSFVGVFLKGNVLISATGDQLDLLYGQKVRTSGKLDGTYEVKSIGGSWYLQVPLSAASLFVVDDVEPNRVKANTPRKTEKLQLYRKD